METWENLATVNVKALEFATETNLFCPVIHTFLSHSVFPHLFILNNLICPSVIHQVSFVKHQVINK